MHGQALKAMIYVQKGALPRSGPSYFFCQSMVLIWWPLDLPKYFSSFNTNTNIHDADRSRNTS